MIEIRTVLQDILVNMLFQMIALHPSRESLLVFQLLA